MKKGKVARLAGFVGALGVSAVLVTTAVQGTGAYFSDSVNGSIASSSGHLTLTTSGATNLNYANLMPGSPVAKSFNYKVSVSSGGVDVWMVFDPTTWGYQAFTGASDATDSPLAPGGGLGRYGYFQVTDSNGGPAFRTGNLSFAAGSGNKPQSGDCSTDANGRGGSDWIATKENGGQATQYCGVPAAILLASNLGNTDTGTVTVTFGLNGYMQYNQNQTEPTVGFKIVATQNGVRPEAGNTYEH